MSALASLVAPLHDVVRDMPCTAHAFAPVALKELQENRLGGVLQPQEVLHTHVLCHLLQLRSGHVREVLLVKLPRPGILLVSALAHHHPTLNPVQLRFRV